MNTPHAALADFAIADKITFDQGHGALDRMTLRGAGGTAQLYLLGAHVSSFIPDHGEELLMLSEKSVFAVGSPIRGGIPLCWPWFGPPPVKDGRPAHGVARLQPWQVLDTAVLADGRVRARLALSIHPDYAQWLPQGLRAELTVTVGASLEVALETINDGAEPCSFADALHTYLRVGEIQQVSVLGLENCVYIDKMAAGAARVQEGAVVFSGETDRVYNDAGDSLRVVDAALGRSITVSKSGSANTVVWNPWTAKAAAMPDFGDDEWPGMVCVETANCLGGRRMLLPGDRHRTVTSLRVSA